MQDLLEIFEQTFTYILKHLRAFFNLNNHNVAYLTLYQEPLVNGLNTGGFDIQEDSKKSVDRLLAMLEQYLISNQELSLNKSFKVYINVLSIDHDRYKATLKRKTKTTPLKKTKKVKVYGIRKKQSSNPDCKYQMFWSIDIPQTITQLFLHKCLLLCCLLGLLHHEYLENYRCNKFLIIQNITSSIEKKKLNAKKLLMKELEKLENKLENLNEFHDIATKISDVYKCQIFIFKGKQKAIRISEIVPSIYSDNLKPIFLYQPLEEPNHLVYIRNLTAFFRNHSTICLACKKSFRTPNYRHLCPVKSTCFSCRRFFQSESTYVNSMIKPYFCDGKIVSQNSTFVTCFKCNVDILSPHCLNEHSKICNKGWKCLKCKKFTYRSGDGLKTINEIKQNHLCGYKVCPYCKKQYEKNLDKFHLCQFKSEIIKTNSPKLAFLNVEFIYDFSDNCPGCFEIREAFCFQNNIDWVTMTLSKEYPTLCCFRHKNKNRIFDPNIIVIYHEKYPFMYSKTILTSFMVFEYESEAYHFKNQSNFIVEFEECKKSKTFEVSLNILKKLFLSKPLVYKFFKMICSDAWKNTTFVCLDEDGILFVSIYAAIMIKILPPSPHSISLSLMFTVGANS